MRINGRARVVTDADLLAGLTEGGKAPKTATVVLVDEVLLHCGKAINRAGLWQPDAHLARDALPTVGAMLAALTKMTDAGAGMSEGQVEEVNAHYAHEVKHNLY
jgi:predicted pyridoxine 5'-phosphate oxidase superfamily flavin-nucleotide-binding protein